ncbi:MAG: DNA topoisomerase IB, partial [Legionella sp.]
SANSHLQATGFDSKNRKQYRYHPLWRKIRQENKFKSMIPFGKMLANIRKHVDEELNKPVDLDKNQIICAIIYLMDNYFIRIGNSTYEKQNQSYGLTTLRKKHLSLSTTKAILEFAGKNSKPWHIVLKDKKLLKILKKCEDIPGYRLFKYLDENKTYTEITSQDINSYLQNLTNYSLTAKDFRTWAACRETLYRLIQVPYDNEENSTALLKEVIVEVSTMLGHTPTICQKYYIVPDIISEWKSGAICEWVKKHPNLAKDKDKMLLAWLEEHV